MFRLKPKICNRFLFRKGKRLPCKSLQNWFKLTMKHYIISKLSKWKYLVVFGSIVFFCSKWSTDETHSKKEIQSYMRRPAEYYINTKGCFIPTIDESGASTLHCLRNITRCVKTELLKRNQTHIWLNEYRRDIRCCYEAIDNEIVVSELLSEIINPNQCKKIFNFSFKVPSLDKHARVICFLGREQIYENIFLFAPKMPFTAFDEQRDDNYTYNVLILGLDSVSRLNFRRTMPKTLSAITKLKAVEFLGYSTIGRKRHVYSSLAPLLVTIQEHSSSDSFKSKQKSKFIWELYKEMGFYTAVGESSLAKFYNPIKKHAYGTLDYWWHLYWHQEFQDSYDSELCLQEKPFHEALLDYIKDLTTSFKSAKLFGFFWESTLCKYCLAYPKLMDESYATFFEHLVESGYSHNTVIFFTSNHGIKHLDFIKLNQGKRELRLPFLYIIVPPSFRDKFKNAYRNLKQNSKVLTTPYDVLKTLIALTNLPKISDTRIPVEVNLQNVGISLFNLIPEDRKCTDAALVQFWCSCIDMKPMNVNITQARMACLFLRQYLNHLIQNEKRCAYLDIDLIFNVTQGKSYINDNEYMIEVRMRPGNAILKAAVVNNNAGHDWSLRSVFRKNPYVVPHCASVEELAPFCHCI